MGGSPSEGPLRQSEARARSQRPPSRRKRAGVGENRARQQTKHRSLHEQTSVEQNKAHHRAVMGRERSRGAPRERRSRRTSRPRLPVDRPRLVFQHLQKTAGTALRRVIHANLVGEDAEAGEVEHVVLDVPKTNRARTASRPV